MLRSTYPAMWTHAQAGVLSFVDGLGAVGTSLMVDLRAALVSEFSAQSIIQEALTRRIGLMAAGRFPDDVQTNYERAPTPTESDDAIALLIDEFSTDAAIELSSIFKDEDGEGPDSLIYRSNVEPISGPGEIIQSQRDGCFAHYEAIAPALKAACPHVRQSSPGLNGAGTLIKPQSATTAEQIHRRGMMVDFIALADAHQEYIDVHVGGEDAAQWLANINAVVQYCRENEIGENCRLACFEWGIVAWEDRDDTTGACAEVVRMVKLGHRAGVSIMAYRPGTANAGAGPGGLYEWSAVRNADGTPNEPFYTTVRRLCGCSRTRLAID